MTRTPVGIIGLGVMGASLARNIAGKGFPVVGYTHTPGKAARFAADHASEGSISAVDTLAALAAALPAPRVAILMVTAGAPVDAVIDGLVPHLSPGDVLVDGGNSRYTDTADRCERLAASGISFVGMGVSGGEQGALHGPSLMPGGSAEAYAVLRPILERIAATSDTGPCVAHVGPGGAGHFVKMVHNGIEYGDMQLIGEAYHVLRYGAGLAPVELARVFREWNQGELQSYLIEITSEIVDFPDDRGAGGILLDHIRDTAGQKGTGRWTIEAAMDTGVPVPTITAAVDARLISSLAPLRARAAELYRKPAADPLDPERMVPAVRAGLYASKICCYAQGFALIAGASAQFAWGVDLAETARIWKNGCIIRAGFLDRVRSAYSANPGLENLLLAPEFRDEVAERISDLRELVDAATHAAIPLPAMSASLAYVDSLASAHLPANLLQAQRDYFGAHKYERTDMPGTFHTEWY